MTEHPTKPDPVAHYRAVLDSLDPRLRIAAKLRALFPMIETQLAPGGQPVYQLARRHDACHEAAGVGLGRCVHHIHPVHARTHRQALVVVH